MSQYLSLRKGEIVEVEESLANELIASGLASEYKLLEPEGKLPIKKATEYDCGAYATAQIEDANLTAAKIKKNTTILGVRGTYESQLSSLAVSNQTGYSLSGVHLTITNGKVQSGSFTIENGGTSNVDVPSELGISTANSNLRIFKISTPLTAVNVTNGVILATSYIPPDPPPISPGLVYSFWILSQIGATEMTITDGTQQSEQ